MEHGVQLHGHAASCFLSLPLCMDLSSIDPPQPPLSIAFEKFSARSRTASSPAMGIEDRFMFQRYVRIGTTCKFCHHPAFFFFFSPTPLPFHCNVNCILCLRRLTSASILMYIFLWKWKTWAVISTPTYIDEDNF